ncbi:hypothetical protein N9924_00690 [bacterium]|nr:hypothetical protein [bacterium]
MNELTQQQVNIMTDNTNEIAALEDHLAPAYDVEALGNQITELARAERVTKKLLGSLSRDLLGLYVETGDVTLMNRLLGIDEDAKFILTPMNWRLAVQYFRSFIPHASNWEDLKDAVIKGGKREPFVFGKKSGNRAKKIGDALTDWLAVDTNDIWVFSDTVKVEAKDVDFAKRITQAVTAALDEEKGAMQPLEVFAAIFDADGINVNDLIAAMEAADIDRKEPLIEAAA